MRTLTIAGRRFVECVETFPGIIELDDAADRSDHFRSRGVLKIVRPRKASRASSITSGDFIVKSLASARARS